MTNRNRALGNGLEARVVSRAKERGLRAHQQPGSGIYKDYPNDVVVNGMLGECKVRTTLPSLAQLLEWLAYVESNSKKGEYTGAFLVFNQKGSRKPKVMLDLDLFLDILQLQNGA